MEKAQRGVIHRNAQRILTLQSALTTNYEMNGRPFTVFC